MDVSFLDRVFTAPGPYATVCADVTHNTENADTEVELRVRAITEKLSEQGAPEPVVTAVQDRLLEVNEGGEAGTLHGRALVVAYDGSVVLDQPLVAAPTVMLMDEPSMGLAPKIVDEVFRVIGEIRASGTTVVLVEQNARRALRAADHGYVLQSGAVVHSGPAAELLADERIVQAYLGVESTPERP